MFSNPAHLENLMKIPVQDKKQSALLPTGGKGVGEKVYWVAEPQ